MSRREKHISYADLPGAERLCFLALAMNDFRSAAVAATLASKLNPKKSETCESFFIHAEAAVTRYARSFMGNNIPNAGKKARIERVKVQGLSLSIATTDKLLELHDWAIGQRHQVVAHSDLTDRSIGVRVLKDGKVTTYRAIVTTLNMTPGNMVVIGRMSEALYGVLLLEFASLLEALHPDKVKSGADIWLHGSPPDPATDLIAGDRKWVD